MKEMGWRRRPGILDGAATRAWRSSTGFSVPFIGSGQRGSEPSMEELDSQWRWTFMASFRERGGNGVTT
jgi:hypothetical protein